MDLPIIVPCYFQNEESHRLLEMEDSLGIQMDVDFDSVYDIRNVYLFSVNYVFEHPNGDSTMIGSGVEDFRSPMKIEDVLKLLK
jgi:hypothetical protein